MASMNQVELDEIVHSRPDVLDWWVNEIGGQPMDENMIHRYFCESPFFDWSTKNGLIFTQGARDEHTWHMTHNRQELEDNLRRRQGAEYIIVGQPQPLADKDKAGQNGNTGIYVIRKQDRQRSKDDLPARQPGVLLENGWELTSLGTYFTVGEHVFQAPSVRDVVGNRLLAATSSLSEFFDIASDLPSYSPASGYSYISTASKQTTGESIHASPAQSREGSVAPGAESHSQRSASLRPETQIRSAASTADVQDTRLLAESLRMAISYADEFADENPLVGEPGHFSFTSSVAAVKRRRADEEAAAAAKARAEKESNPTSRATSPKPEKAHSPPAVFQENKITTKGEKGGKDDRRGGGRGDKQKRRKSKMNALAQSPTTPSSAASTLPPNSAI